MAITEKWAQEEMTAKGKPLQKMFDQVPEKYDFLNRIMTLGLDQIWRKKAAAYIIREQPRKVLDVGTGTGDMALFLAGQLPQAEVIGYDFSAPMLRKAEKKAEDTQLTNIKFIEGDVADIPLEDKSVDM
ncbi:MAG: class I SAM-dependent methyltransferase, partial [Bacteroidales bacterium]